MKSLRIVFAALAIFGAVVAVSAGSSDNVVVASDGGSPMPPHTGGRK